MQDLTFVEGPLLKAFNLAILKVETAGGQGPDGGSDMTLLGIINAEDFRNEVMEQRESLSENKQPKPSSDNKTNDNQTADMNE
ncbi:MAG: hypothetical protein ABEH43_08410, partial [Flavobacteriales bacterium]